jgi:hypothetical protein
MKRSLQCKPSGDFAANYLKGNTMKIEQIIDALQSAKLYDAAKLQCDNIDNLSMLVAVATGRVATYNELYELFRQLTA